VYRGKTPCTLQVVCIYTCTGTYIQHICIEDIIPVATGHNAFGFDRVYCHNNNYNVYDSIIRLFEYH